MTQKWEAVVGSATYLLSGGSLSYRLTVHGTGLPSVRRLTHRSPQQHGETDLGFRYDARQIRLGFFFHVGSDGMADTRRTSLYEIWKSLESTPVKLKVTLDNGDIRQIDCYVRDVVDMPDDLNDRVGSSQRFVVTVTAANPMWYNPTQASTSFTSADNLDWWLALGTVTAGQVAEHVESPTQGQGISDSVVIADGSPWTLFFRTNQPSVPSSVEYAFLLRDAVGNISAVSYYVGGSNAFQFRGNSAYESVTGVFATGIHDYFAVVDGATYDVYRDATYIGQITASTKGVDGTEDTVWRAGGSSGTYAWTPAIPYGAVFNVALSNTQRTSLISAINGVYSASKTITYSGSFAEYPVIIITGPITSPVLTNVSTGEDLDFTGITISGGDTYTIDCRFGYKTVKNAAGTNKIADLTAASDLATFHLAAAPEVSSGANAFTLTGTGTTAATTVTVAYYNRYVGI